MKWYKKQLDQLKKDGKFERQTESTTEDGSGKIPKYPMVLKKSSYKKSSRSPVAASKLKRPKTDAR